MSGLRNCAPAAQRLKSPMRRGDESRRAFRQRGCSRSPRCHSLDFIRLPTYARHLSGLTTTEGDRILHADVVRQQSSLDGTGVRVGVVSDGLKGVFPSGWYQLQRAAGRTYCHRRSARSDRCPKQRRCAGVVDRRHHRPVVSGERRSRGTGRTRGSSVWIRRRRRRRDGDA